MHAVFFLIYIAQSKDFHYKFAACGTKQEIVQFLAQNNLAINCFRLELSFTFSQKKEGNSTHKRSHS